MIRNCSAEETDALSRLAQKRSTAMRQDGAGRVLLECVQTEETNDALLTLLEESYRGRIEVVRGGSVAIEASGFPCADEAVDGFREAFGGHTGIPE